MTKYYASGLVTSGQPHYKIFCSIRSISRADTDVTDYIVSLVVTIIKGLVGS